MVSSSQQLLQRMWADNKDALTVMCLDELAGADVSMNVRWEGSPDVVVGTVLESEFSLPTRSDMTNKRARSSPEANACSSANGGFADRQLRSIIASQESCNLSVNP